MKKPQIIAGVDEAGRGCLAGPVVAGAVILPKKYPKAFLQDSKILSEKKREKSYEWIIKNCDASFGEASAKEIDALGIKKATSLAMQRAVKKLKKQPNFLKVDGRDGFTFNIESEDFVKGDARFACIAAASIVAKVTRDKKMKKYDKEFPKYNFGKHKGYGTKKHRDIIESGSYTPLHRKTYDPLRTILEQERLFS